MSPWWLRPPAEESEAVLSKDDAAPKSGDTAAAPVVSPAPAKRPSDRPRPPRRRRRRPGRTAESRSGSKVSPKARLPGVVAEDERRLAVFCDLESIALANRESASEKFEIERVLVRLLDKGKIVVRKAYADWERHRDFKTSFHDSGFELIDIPQQFFSGKSAADIKMSVDAMEKCYSKQHLDTFVILSGAGEFSPLAAKLKENDKKVIGIGVKSDSAKLLIDACDEFLFYEDLALESGPTTTLVEGLDSQQAEAFTLMEEAIRALQRENKRVLWGSMVKQTMKRKHPSFNEAHYGYSAFSEMLEDAERRKIIELERDERSGSYIVTGFAGG